MLREYIKLLLLFFMSWAMISRAGIGVFKLDSNGITVSGDQFLALLKEDVNISTSTPENISLLKEIDQIWLKVKCNITIKNLEKLPVDVLLGFPVCNNPQNAQSYEQMYFKRNISKNIMGFKFNVTDANNNKQYIPIFSLEDTQKLYVGIFCWKMYFAPEEVKSFVVSYYVPLLRLQAFPGKNMYLPGTRPELYSTNEVLYGGLSSCYRLQIDYVITHDCFNKHIKPETEVQIRLLPILNELNSYKTAWMESHSKGTIMPFPKHPYLFALIYPRPDHINDGTVYWKKINDSCEIYFFKTQFSKDANEMERFIDTLYKIRQTWLNTWEKVFKKNITIFDGEIRKNYLKQLENIRRLKKYSHLRDDFHDIYLEFIKKPTHNERIQSFLKKQIWYSTTRKMMNGFIVMFHKNSNVECKAE